MNLLVFSSLLFITNSINGIYKNNIIYSILFLLLTITSVFVHSYKDNIFINIIDKIIIIFVFLYGLYIIKNKNNNENRIKILAIISSFLFVCWIYIGGFIYKEYVFESYQKNTELFHIIMHYVGSLGNHLILFL